MPVHLEVVIGELRVPDGEEFGLDYLLKRTGPGSAGGPATPEPSPASSPASPKPTGLALLGATGGTLDDNVRALESTNRFRIISHPSVFTTDNKQAVIASGRQVPVPTTLAGSRPGTTTPGIAYEDALLQLDITPHLNANHEVTLQIRGTTNSLGKNVTINGNQVPIINTQEITTEVTVPDKSTVVMGGLVPGDATPKERKELVILIQPSVIEPIADTTKAE